MVGLGCECRIGQGPCRQAGPHAWVEPPAIRLSVKADRSRAARGADSEDAELPEAEHRTATFAGRSFRPACDEAPVAGLVRPDASAMPAASTSPSRLAARVRRGSTVRTQPPLLDASRRKSGDPVIRQVFCVSGFDDTQAVGSRAIASSRVDMVLGGVSVKQNSKPYRCRCLSWSGSS